MVYSNSSRVVGLRLVFLLHEKLFAEQFAAHATGIKHILT